MNKEEFEKIVSDLPIHLDEEKYNLLKKYAIFLQEYNKHTNLTAITDIKEIFIKHFYDSLTLTKVINMEKVDSFLDIGTGAGFPGVVLKIMFPNLKLVLLDSNKKKTTFLNELVNKLNLQNVNIVSERAEDYARKNLNAFSLVTARAVANLRIISELAIPFVKTNGYFIAMKGNAEDELKEAQKTIDKMGSIIENRLSFNLPSNEGTRTLIVIKKCEDTKLALLRPYNKIIKSELK